MDGSRGPRDIQPGGRPTDNGRQLTEMQTPATGRSLAPEGRPGKALCQLEWPADRPADHHHSALGRCLRAAPAGADPNLNPNLVADLRLRAAGPRPARLAWKPIRLISRAVLRLPGGFGAAGHHTKHLGLHFHFAFYIFHPPRPAYSYRNARLALIGR